MITSHPFTVRRQDGIGPHPDDHPCAATVPNGLNGHIACNRPRREHASTNEGDPNTPGKRPPSRQADEPELWVAYNASGPTYAVFFTEIEALRHAVGEMMQVERIAPGELWEQINIARKARGAQ